MHIPALTHLTPDAALLLLTLGILLVYLELNRPGSILPGALGLLATLLAAASLAQYPLKPMALLFLAASILILARALRRDTSNLFFAAATLCLIEGLAQLTTPQPHLYVALPCGILLGVATTVLTRIARRARINKGLA